MFPRQLPHIPLIVPTTSSRDLADSCGSVPSTSEGRNNEEISRNIHSVALSKQILATIVLAAALLAPHHATAQGGVELTPGAILGLIKLPQLSATADPVEVREGRPFKVSISFKLGRGDDNPATTPGRIVISHGGKDVIVSVPKLELEQTFTKTVEVIAGRAGRQVVTGEYFADARPGVPGEEFPVEQSIASCSVDLRIRAQFYVTLDRMVVGQTRASTRDVDFIWFGSSLSGGDIKTDQKIMHDVGISPHRVDLAAGPFEFFPDVEGAKLEFQSAFFITNKGFEGSAEQKAKEAGDLITQIVAGGFGAAFGSSGGSGGGQSGGSWNALGAATVELHDAMVNHGLGADGVVANEYVRLNASLVEDRTSDGSAYEVKTTCYGLSSGDATGSVQPSRYYVFLKFHRDATVYRVRVVTGDVPDAETDSHVFITIRGDRGSTGEQELDNIQRNFQGGLSEQFIVVGKDVGRITSIRIRHDNTFDDKSWFLQEVTVEDANSNESASFVYGDWLSTTAGPKQIDVELSRG